MDISSELWCARLNFCPWSLGVIDASLVQTLGTRIKFHVKHSRFNRRLPTSRRRT